MYIPPLRDYRDWVFCRIKELVTLWISRLRFLEHQGSGFQNWDCSRVQGIEAGPSGG